MKKNISINISGIIFHIEEDGYEQLRNYLDTINQYFSSYEDSAEIIADIESRIAEIFLVKLKDGKQVITAADVQSLMTTMGSIQDFEAIEEEPKFQREEEKHYRHNQSADEHTVYESKKLYRDSKRKILGGVAAGIANHFSIDPLWVRLVLIVLFFDLFVTFSIGTIVLIGYIVCWIIIPPSSTIEDDRKVKKMFRNPDDRVLGGVSGGLAAYFGVDATVIRLLFVISIFAGGAGIIIYFILWIITPEAKSITDKMQMQGEPVTLSNIETNIKKSLDVKEGEEENILVKILLFPFRLIAIIFSGLAKALGPLMLFIVEAIRVIFGIAIIIFAGIMLFSLVAATGFLLNIWSGELQFFGPVVHDFPLDLFAKSFPGALFVSSFIAILVPVLALSLLGIGVLAKRMVIVPTVGWSMFAIWIISLLGLAVTLPATIGSFKSEATFRTEKKYDLEDKTAVLTLTETGLEDYEATSLKLLGHEGADFRLVQKFYSRGSSRQDALNNAQMVTYNVKLEDSILYFDSNIRFKEEAQFRGQELEMILYIPFDTPFQMKENLKHIIRGTIYSSGHTIEQMEGNNWMFTEENGLQCITCPRDEDVGEAPEGISSEDGFSNFEDLTDYNSLDIDGLYEIVVTKGSKYSVVLSGDERIIENTEVRKNGNTLTIDQKGLKISGSLRNPQVKVIVTMPALEAIKLDGATKAYLDGFEGDHLDVSLSGSSRSEFMVNYKDIALDMSGDSKLELSGEGRLLDADLSGASRLLAGNFKVKDASVETSGISSATVNVSNTLNENANGASRIENLHTTSDAQSFNSESKGFYISKAQIIYYATLLKAGVLTRDASFKGWFGSNN